jgi:dTMP kinase
MRFEGMGLAVQQKARAGFLALAASAPSRFRIIDGAHAPESVAQAVLAAALAHLRAR